LFKLLSYIILNHSITLSLTQLVPTMEISERIEGQR
jgi:hypothetical protein